MEPTSRETEKVWKLPAPRHWGSCVHSGYAGVKIHVTVNDAKIYKIINNSLGDFITIVQLSIILIVPITTIMAVKGQDMWEIGGQGLCLF